MKTLFALLLIITSAYAQDPTAYLKTFDSKVYSLKSKGVKEFVVDIENSKLTKQMNDQQLFGKVEELIFRVYWTAIPERLAIEVIGLPQGFKEVKEDLKMSIAGVLDNILPTDTIQRFKGYNFSNGGAKEIIAKDSTGVAPIQTYLLKFDQQDRLTEIKGNMAIGTQTIRPVYQKESFADGRWVLTSQTIQTSENGQTLTIKKDLDYSRIDGIGVVSEVVITTEHKSNAPDSKPVSSSEKIEFKNHKINTGEALKYFLGESKAAPSVPQN